MHDWIKQLWSHCSLPNKPTHGLLTAQIAGITHVHPALACLDSLSHVQSATNSKLWYVMIRHHSALFLPYSTWKKWVRIGGGCICWHVANHKAVASNIFCANSFNSKSFTESMHLVVALKRILATNWLALFHLRLPPIAYWQQHSTLYFIYTYDVLMCA